MSMPKGHKSEFGYATVTGDSGGMDYRTIAEKMTADGHKMNHATARNIFLRAMNKLASPVCTMYLDDTNAEKIDQTARDPRFQSSMVELVMELYSDDEEYIDQ